MWAPLGGENEEELSVSTYAGENAGERGSCCIASDDVSNDLGTSSDVRPTLSLRRLSLSPSSSVPSLASENSSSSPSSSFFAIVSGRGLSSRLISKTGSSSSQIPSPSQSTRSNGGFMFKLGQNTSRRLLKGILVSLLSLAVALISSVTVRIRSRFSSGSCLMRTWKASRRDFEGGFIPVKVGIARVDREGGFLIAGKGRPLPRGPEGNPGPLETLVLGAAGSAALLALS